MSREPVRVTPAEDLGTKADRNKETIRRATPGVRLSLEGAGYLRLDLPGDTPKEAGGRQDGFRVEFRRGVVTELAR